MNLIELPDLVLAEIFQYFNPNMKLPLLLSCKRFYLFIPKYPLLSLNQLALKVRVLFLEFGSSLGEMLKEFPLSFGNNTYFGTRKMVPVGRNMTITFQFWSIPPESEHSHVCDNTFAVVFSLGKSHFPIETFNSAKQKFCPKAEVYFRIYSDAYSSWKVSLEAMGELYTDDEQLLASLEKKVLQRFDPLQRMRQLVKYTDKNNNNSNLRNTPQTNFFTMCTLT